MAFDKFKVLNYAVILKIAFLAMVLSAAGCKKDGDDSSSRSSTEAEKPAEAAPGAIAVDAEPEPKEENNGTVTEEEAPPADVPAEGVALDSMNSKIPLRRAMMISYSNEVGLKESDVSGGWTFFVPPKKIIFKKDQKVYTDDLYDGSQAFCRPLYQVQRIVQLELKLVRGRLGPILCWCNLVREFSSSLRPSRFAKL